ncbi:hypothetical protein VPH35_082879 [Triticum aestivum]
MAGPSLPTPPPVEEPQTGAAKSGTTVDALTVDMLRDILRRLSLADLLRAALACHRWRRVAARCLPRTAPLLGYFFHPTATGLPPPMPKSSKEIDTPAVFAPLDASAPNLSLDFAPEASRFVLHDCHQGLLLLEPLGSLPKGILPRFLVIDPATRRRRRATRCPTTTAGAAPGTTSAPHCFPRAPEQALLRGRLLRHRRRAPARLGRVRGRRPMQLARAPADHGGRGRF